MWCRQTSQFIKTIVVLLACCGSLTFTGCNSNRETSAKGGIQPGTKSAAWTVTRNSITRAAFESALQKNSNAPFDTTFADSVRLENARRTIDKYYTEEEKELAKLELCKSPRCLTTFKAYYPGPDLLLFYIADNHFVKAAFVKAGTGEMAQKEERFNGDFGVLSKNGYWIGLKRQDSDNHLKLEICRFVDGRFQSLVSREYTDIDISEYNAQPMFWGEDNTVYIATHAVGKSMPEDDTFYYMIRFTNEVPK